MEYSKFVWRRIDLVSFLYQSTEESSRERGDKGEASGWSASAMKSRIERYIPE